MSDATQRVTQALQAIVCNPEHDEAKIREFFSPQYRQYVDGESLDFRGFVEHMAKLKQLAESIEVTMVAIAGQHQDVLTHHHVAVSKKGGGVSHVDVLAHFTLQDGMIIRCEELTRLIQGAAEDSSLGHIR
ncbi:nuclear transport factor 2 family protein [Kosakonia sp. ML.JS2a]|uniref:nuclear transport factor 2 family protein n=1 Tax=Kosakonia sp. ML.JS2a TaxID=2980557 RepID=UPI0021DA5498|nr:nuclear transport factor 2 family protein [Kosakonia sp. ML.JS2a]UXY11534.1 nuclear transport factor 2 family protein [Kosakonia sp. ML.JS2a]